MPLTTTYRAKCDGCGKRKTESRVREPNVNPPEHLVPHNWTETKKGVFCPKCTEKNNA